MRSRRLLSGVLVGLAAVAVYLNALPGAFVYDDNALVRFNASIRDASRAADLRARPAALGPR